MRIADLDCLVLAGGLGTRLRSVLPSTPKVMATVGGRPFLEHVLMQLESMGLRRCILCVGFLATQIKEHFAGQFGRLTIYYSEERLLLGTAGALRFASSMTSSDPLLVVNGDTLARFDLADFVQFHITQACPASIALAQVPDGLRYGSVLLDKRCRLTSFVEKGQARGPALVNAGAYLINRQLIESIPVGRPVSLERDVFEQMPADIAGFLRPNNKLMDIGTPDSLREAQHTLMEMKTEDVV